MNETDTTADAVRLSIDSAMRRTFSLHVMVDPATIAAIISIGESIASLFGGGNDTDKMIDLLNQLQQSVTNLSQRIDSIVQQLSELKVSIDQDFIRQKDADVLGICEAIRAYLPVWKTNQDRCAREVPDHLEPLQYAVGANMRYSYAGYDTVAYGMSTERILLELLNEVSSVKQARIGQYLSYFQTNLNLPDATPNDQGTVGDRLASATSAKAAFLQSNTLQSESRFIQHVTGMVRGTIGQGDLVFIFDGSPETGYTARPDVLNVTILVRGLPGIGGTPDRYLPLPDSGGLLAFPIYSQNQWRAAADATAAKLASDTSAELNDIQGSIDMLTAAHNSLANYAAAASGLIEAM